MTELIQAIILIFVLHFLIFFVFCDELKKAYRNGLLMFLMAIFTSIQTDLILRSKVSV